MKASLLWNRPSSSCLGDRLLDTMLLSTLAKLINADLYFPWVECIFEPNAVGEPQWKYKNGENKTWDKTRFEDYRFENYSPYFNLPKNIKINESVDSPNYIFEDYLGGVVSPHLFYEKYLQNICSLDTFTHVFNETMSEFTATEKLLSLTENLQKPSVSVHLRRTDKIRVDADYSTNMTYEGLDILNNLTHSAIQKLYDGEKLFYFSSEDSKVRDEYNNMYSNHIKHHDIQTFEKTYIDLYMLISSEYIILSQVHSNFSVFASFVNQSKLVYLYDKCLIVDQKFNKSKNFVYYLSL